MEWDNCLGIKTFLIKLDFEKAYDQLEWFFILAMLLVVYWGHFLCMLLIQILGMTWKDFILPKLFLR